MSTEIIAIAIGIVITWLLFTWIVKVLKASISTAVMIVILLLGLQFFLGIHYEEVWQELVRVVREFFID